MIGRLRGEVAEIDGEDVLIDVHGVGYLVRCGARTMSRLPAPGETVTLQIETQTREDGTRLFGFLTRDDRGCFVALQAIQGVGPKAALSVLDILSPSELAAAAARDDKAMVARANGVGPKLAQRIVTELKGKVLPGAATFDPTTSTSRRAPLPVSRTGEAVAALLGLGIAEANARRAVDAADQRLGEDASLAALIKAALQELGR